MENMKFTPELIEKAKAAKSADEIMELAKANEIENFTRQDAITYYVQLHKTGEISDEELDNVAGGCGGKSKPWHDEEYECDRFVRQDYCDTLQLGEDGCTVCKHSTDYAYLDDGFCYFHCELD